jgi:hypothetical protein
VVQETFAQKHLESLDIFGDDVAVLERHGANPDDHDRMDPTVPPVVAQWQILPSWRDVWMIGTDIRSAPLSSCLSF